MWGLVQFFKCLLLHVYVNHAVQQVECNCKHYSRMVVNGDTIPVDCMHNRTLLCQRSVGVSESFSACLLVPVFEHSLLYMD